jgi:NurA-like 5'-3' nuclease
VITGKNITATVASGISSLTVKAAVSEKASWKLYFDKACTKEVKGNKLKLKTGVNTSYIKVTAEDKTTKIYKVTITRDKKITKKAEEQYKSHIRLGLIGSGEYAKKVAKIFEQEYDSANVMLQEKGKYYLVTMDFKDKAAAKKACEDMISRQYIVNYYFE